MSPPPPATFHDLEDREAMGRSAWRHPTNPAIILPYNHAAVVAVMQMGISDPAMIAAAVGLDAATVERIDLAEDPAIRLLAVARIPFGQYFKLLARVRCPRCHGWVQTAPCMACAQQLSDQREGRRAVD